MPAKTSKPRCRRDAAYNWYACDAAQSFQCRAHEQILVATKQCCICYSVTEFVMYYFDVQRRTWACLSTRRAPIVLTSACIERPQERNPVLAQHAQRGKPIKTWAQGAIDPSLTVPQAR